MYKKDTAIEIQFAPQRLNDAAGDPYWIDLSAPEARRLLQQLQVYFAPSETARQSAPVFLLDAPDGSAVAAASPAAAAPRSVLRKPDDFKQWVCVICGWIYDEAAGLPEEGIEPGTRWADVPADWRCPLCDVGKEDFALVEF
jgi:rubredoxin